jgi:hypothetical protein
VTDVEKKKDRQLLIACIGGFCAIVAAFATPIWTTFFSNPTPPATESLVDDTPSGQPFEGAWKQYVTHPVHGNEVHLGTFVVSKYKGDYAISARAQSEDPEHLNSIAIYDVRYDGKRLTFNSNWGNGQVGNFEMQRTSPSEFKGVIYVAGQPGNHTRFVKIE